MVDTSELDGLDGRDVASDSHPYLHQAARREHAVSQVRNGLVRRKRTARFTPGGLKQPPELAGVDADARVPNPLQPMNGEMDATGEVGQGRPGYFGVLMPAPTGVANGVGVGEIGAADTGGPRRAAIRPAPLLVPPTGVDRGLGARSTKQISQRELAGFGPEPRGLSDLAGLPQFALGGVLLPGGSGLAGENGPETITALPGGGARIVPAGLPGAIVSDSTTSDLSGVANLLRQHLNVALTAPPQAGRAAQPRRGPRHSLVAGPLGRAPAWKQALLAGIGGLAAGITRDPRYGAEVAQALQAGVAASRGRRAQSQPGVAGARQSKS